MNTRRDFFRRCLATAVATPTLPALARAAPAVAESMWVHVPILASDDLVEWAADEFIRINALASPRWIAQYTNEAWNRIPSGSLRSMPPLDLNFAGESIPEADR